MGTLESGRPVSVKNDSELVTKPIQRWGGRSRSEPTHAHKLVLIRHMSSLTAENKLDLLFRLVSIDSSVLFGGLSCFTVTCWLHVLFVFGRLL